MSLELTEGTGKGEAKHSFRKFSIDSYNKTDTIYNAVHLTLKHNAGWPIFPVGIEMITSGKDNSDSFAQ